MRKRESLPYAARDRSPPPRSNGSGNDGSESHACVWHWDPQRAPASAETDFGDDASSDSDGLGLMEAFENFNLQAARRVKALLETTDAKLFAEESAVADPLDAPSLDTPSYILLSDQYRLARPPQFHHWRQCFPYLQITGKSAFNEAPDEHIQIRPALPPSMLSPVWDADGEMAVVGKAVCLEMDTSDPPQEEIILADGEMEEIVNEDRPESIASCAESNSVDDADDDERRLSTGFGTCVSPRTARAEEAVDQLTLEWFTEMVPPLCRSIFARALCKQQLGLRVSREAQEEQVRRAQATLAAAKEAEFFRIAQEEHERLVYEAAIAQAQDEERIREEERLQEIVRQQLEENDEEEIKIRTLAYSHLREWYQPKKKCFSHRGRQLTYLKPVLAEAALKLQPTGLTPKKPSSSKRSNRTHRMSSPSEADIRHATARTGSPQTSPSTVRSRPPSKHTIVGSNRPRVQLPLIDKPAANGKTKPPPKARTKLARKLDQPPPGSMSRPSATVAAPPRVYNSSPYRIPPALLRPELENDAVAMWTRPNQRTALGD